MNICYDNLVIEITRRCNMACPHCMRGDAQDRDLSHETIDKILDNVSYIGEITLTGGEPSMNVDGIRYLAQEIKRRGIPVMGAYIVTNGKEISAQFLQALVELFTATEMEEDYCGIALSQDDFHEPIPRENIARLKMFRFFNLEDKSSDFAKVRLINLGRARDLAGYKKREPFQYEQDIELDARTQEVTFRSCICITVDGDVLSACDYEYSGTDQYKLGTIYDRDWVAKLVNTLDIA